MHDEPRLRTSLSARLPRPALTAEEIEALRRRAWRQAGVLSLDAGDGRLSWPERELVRRLGERLYGAHAPARAEGTGGGR